MASSPSSSGLSCYGRAAAAVPSSSHPPMHPGATPLAKSASASRRGGLLSKASFSYGTLPARAPTPMTPTPEPLSTCSSPVRKRPPRLMSIDSAFAMTPSPVAGRSMDVDSGWCADFPCSPATTLDEDDIFGAAEDGCHLDSWIGGQRRRPIDPPKTIERLGELMSLLGPRYKTLACEKLWEKAASGDLTAFQRRALQAKGDGGRSRGGAGAGVSGSPSKREAVDADPDGNAR